MTCIAGIEHNGRVYLCGDSAASSGWDIQVVAMPKVFRVNQFVIGCTTSFRMMQLLQYKLFVKQQEQESDYAYMVSVVAETIRALLKGHGYSQVENNREEGGYFLIGYHGYLYQISCDFSVLRYTDGFAAVGCGKNFALGALAILNKSNPEKALMQALEVAAHFSNGVCEPFHCVALS